MGEGLVVAVVVGDGGEGGGVCVEGERRQGRPIPLELTYELRDEVLGLRGGPAGATREHLAPPLVAATDARRRPTVVRDGGLAPRGSPAVATREHLAPPLVAGKDERPRLFGGAGREARKHPAGPVRPIACPGLWR